MKRSTDRILTTHTGSLPRPERLVELIFDKEAGDPVDQALFDAEVSAAVQEIVRKQLDSGVDVINDGEQGKVSYATYVQNRLAGFDGPLTAPPPTRDDDFPDYRFGMAIRPNARTIYRRPCTGPISYKGLHELEHELADFKAALQGVSPEDVFLSAASPAIASLFIPNQYYPTREEYVWAIAEAMKTEYDAIHRAGFLLQIDCPDLAMSRRSNFSDLSLEEYRKVITMHIEVLNWVTKDIPEDRLRMHLCWGNYEGPHIRDTPLIDIVDLVLTARPMAISFEGANPRHEHEWKIWRDVKLPDGKLLIPGVLDSTTNFVEHPELIAERLVRYAELVGRENVMAGSDCGFSTGAGYSMVHPSITWAKLQAAAEGAKIASQALWA